MMQVRYDVITKNTKEMWQNLSMMIFYDNIILIKRFDFYVYESREFIDSLQVLYANTILWLLIERQIFVLI